MRLLLWLAATTLLVAAPPVEREITPVLETESVDADVDDPAIWIHKSQPAQSLIIGTIKSPKPLGGLVVYSLDGKILERVRDIDRPNNVDILGDICVTTERLARQLRVYRVSPTAPHLTLLGTIPVFTGEQGEQAAPMGIALWRRPADRALFAFVSRKTGPRDGYLWQYQLTIDGQQVSGAKVRAFGSFSGAAEIEAVAVDHRRGLVYYSDENCCVHVWHADPTARNADQEVTRFATTGFRANREGIGITARHIIVTDQLTPHSDYHVFRHKDHAPVAIWHGKAESTDGLDVTATPLGPRFPHGLLVVMNNSRRNFQFYALPR
jgi:3-phytase